MSNFENVDAVLEIFFGLLLDFFKKKYMDVFLSCALISPITSLVRDVQAPAPKQDRACENGRVNGI